MPLETQLGFKDESTYGTAVTVDRFAEYNTENIEAKYERVEYAGLRSGQFVQRNDRFVPVMKGAAGPLVFNPLTKGAGFWLKHMQGTVSTGATSDSVTPHTAVMSSFKDDSFTAQINRYDDVSAANRAFTWEGGKVASYEIACEVDGLLQWTLNTDFEDEATGTALASASYPSGAELFSWAGGAVTIGGSSVSLLNIKIAVDNNQKLDRYGIRGSTRKLQPTANGFRKVTWEAEGYWESMTQYNRFASTTTAGALAAIVGTWTGPTLAGVSAYPTFSATVDEARFDKAGAMVAGPELITQKLSGIGMFDGTNSPVTLVYTSTDTSP